MDYRRVQFPDGNQTLLQGLGAVVLLWDTKCHFSGMSVAGSRLEQLDSPSKWIGARGNVADCLGNGLWGAQVAPVELVSRKTDDSPVLGGQAKINRNDRKYDRLGHEVKDARRKDVNAAEGQCPEFCDGPDKIRRAVRAGPSPAELAVIPEE